MEFRKIIDGLQEIIYISDIDTYEVYFINEQGCKALDREDYIGHKCYEVLQKKSSPCEFCTNRHLKQGEFYIWEYKNPVSKRHYILKDTLIEWNGKLTRMELAVDITEKENTSIEVQHKLELKQVLIDCVKRLTSTNNLRESIYDVLERIGKYHEADRAYIFEVTREGKTFDNTYEWCAEGITPQMNLLQNIPRGTIDRWEKLFQTANKVIIENLEDVKYTSPSEYAALKPQGISSLMVVPFKKDNEFTGFIGVDNPQLMIQETTLLDSLTFFFITEMKKRRAENQLEYMSYHDALTGVSNRNGYIKFIEQFNLAETTSFGVAFIDINGLKELNDKFGHASGDAAISGTCQVIKNNFRLQDIFRVGGDEFVILSQNIPEYLFKKNINNMLKEMNETRCCSIAIGHLWTNKDLDIHKMIEKADELMYADKKYHYENLGKEEYPKNTTQIESLVPTTKIDTEIEDETISFHSHYENLCRVTYDHIAHISMDTRLIKKLHTSQRAKTNSLFFENLDKTLDYMRDYLLHPNDRDAFIENWAKITDENESEYIVFEFRIMGDDRKYHWVFACAAKSVINGKKEVFIGMKDINEIVEKYQGYYDSVTGLVSQNMFYDEAHFLLDNYPENKYAVIIFDIDKFKVINDIYGADAGNRALRHIAGAINDTIKKNEICSRIYADTFCILTYSETDKDILSFISVLSKKIGNSEFGLLLKAFYGVVRVINHSTSVIALCNMASYAHKSAKEKGRPVVFYNDSIRCETIKIKEIEKEMESALKNGQFKVYLQPKYDTVSEKIVGAEALVRWIHPEKGIISPDKFIPLFEHNGFIIKLDQYIWEQTCIILKKWSNAGLNLIPISVNVSRLHLLDKNFKKDITAMIDRYELQHKILELEFTESIFIENMAVFSEIVKSLKDEHITVAMDDFGSGYSSLNMLKNIMVDVIKLDCAFFSPISISKREKTILHHTIDMVTELEIKIIAEGVGIQDQVNFLKDMGCNVIQGFFFYKPMPVEEFEKIVFGKI